MVKLLKGSLTKGFTFVVTHPELSIGQSLHSAMMGIARPRDLIDLVTLTDGAFVRMANRIQLPLEFLRLCSLAIFFSVFLCALCG